MRKLNPIRKRSKMSEINALTQILLGVSGKSLDITQLKPVHRLWNKLRYSKGYKTTVGEIQEAINKLI